MSHFNQYIQISKLISWTTLTAFNDEYRHIWAINGTAPEVSDLRAYVNGLTIGEILDMMIYLSILSKIPLIVLVCWGFTKCIAPPNPPAPKDAKRVSRRFEREWFGQVMTVWAARVYDFVGLAEVFTILACQFPDSGLSNMIFTLCTGFGGASSSSRVTCTALAPSAPQIIGLSLILCGTLIRLSAFAPMGKQFVFGASIRRDHRLIKTGPYAFVRHPSYTGMMMSHPGWLFWTFSASSWLRISGILGTTWGKAVAGTYTGVIIVFPLYIVLSRMEIEDQLLKEHFGREWDQWAEKVKYCVIPGVY